MAEEKYDSSAIRTLEWNKHIRQRSGMYIGRLGNGDNPEDGIYILLKEVVDNSIDEFGMGYGKQIQITVEDGSVTVRDFGRGIPLDKVIDATSKLNTGGKFDDKNFKKSVGMNGVGTKAVNALSSYFYVESFRDGKSSWAQFERGNLVDSGTKENVSEKNGTFVKFKPDIYSGSHADEKTGVEGDEDAGRAHGAQSRGAGELAHHGHIRHVEHDL